MIFYIIDLIAEKIQNIRNKSRGKPNKLKLFCVWITLIILITFLFYILGAFEKNNNIPLTFNNNLLKNNVSSYNVRKLPKINNISSKYNVLSSNVKKLPKIDNISSKFNILPSNVSKSPLQDNLLNKSNNILPNIKNNSFSNVTNNNPLEGKINEILYAMKQIPIDKNYEINDYNIE